MMDDDARWDIDDDFDDVWWWRMVMMGDNGWLVPYS